MKYSRHAVERMTQRGISQTDADAVVANPTKRSPGFHDATNFWGYDSDGYRIRVTVGLDGQVKTVSWADRRKL
jgi:Domain of unknown function (DUF4258)